MNDDERGVYDPQDLERLLVRREWAGDADGMAAFYVPDAILDHGGDQPAVGRPQSGRSCRMIAAGRKFSVGDQRPAIICGDLALTSTRFPEAP